MVFLISANECDGDSRKARVVLSREAYYVLGNKRGMSGDCDVLLMKENAWTFDFIMVL